MRPRGRGWRVRWELRNRSDHAVTVLEAWHPHRRFHSSRLVRTVRIAARGSASIEVPARTDVRPDDPIENAFLILRLASGGERFRALVRSSVRAGPDGIPLLRVEAIDVHPARR